jgi:oligosaccharide repeat unit polymerase
MLLLSVEKRILFINILLMLYFLIEYVYFLISGDFYLKLIELQLMIIFLFSVLSIYKVTKNWLDIYIIFLGLIFLFLLTRPFMHLFNLVDMINYNENEWFKIRDGFHFSNFTMIKINFVLIFTILSLNIGYLIGIEKFKFNTKIIYITKSKYLNKKIGYIFFFVGLFAFLIKVYLYVKILNNYGYFYLYSGNYTLPIFVRILDDFFYIGYIVIMSNFPSKKEGYILSFIFLLLYASMLLTGMRGEFFIVFLAIIWMLSFLYNWRIKLWQLIIFGLGLMILAQSILAIKFSNVSFSNINIFETINKFLYSQGVTILVLGYFIEFSNNFVDIYSGFRYLISPFVSIFYTITGQYGNRYEMSPETIYSTSDKLQYFTDPEGYYNGAGTGSTFVAELYGLGGDIILVFLGSFLLAFFMAYLTRKFIYKKYGFFIVMIIIPILFWIPRASYLQPLQKYIFGYILLFGFIFLYNLVAKKMKG